MHCFCSVFLMQKIHKLWKVVYGNEYWPSTKSPLISINLHFSLNTLVPKRSQGQKTWLEGFWTRHSFSNAFSVDFSLSVVPCPGLSIPVNGSMDCHHPLGSFSYRSTCGFTCDEGYELVPSNSTSLECRASGQWNDSQPQCSGMTPESKLLCSLHIFTQLCAQL